MACLVRDVTVGGSRAVTLRVAPGAPVRVAISPDPLALVTLLTEAELSEYFGHFWEFVLEEGEGGAKTFRFQKGPVFSHIVLADQINRGTPKTQAAMLEAMQEHRVTVLGKPYDLALIRRILPYAASHGVKLCISVVLVVASPALVAAGARRARISGKSSSRGRSGT